MSINNFQVGSIKKWSLLFYVILFLVFTFGSKFLYLLTDYFWFQEVGFTARFTKVLFTEVGLGFFAVLIAGIVLSINLWIAKRVSSKPFVIIEPGASISSPFPLPQFAELRQILIPILTLVIVGLCLFMGNWASNQWETLLKFINGVPFGLEDPLFKKDIGFYIFTLPFYKFLYRFSFLLIFFSFLMALALYVLNGRIFVTPRGIKVADDSKLHLVILLGFLSLSAYFHFQFNAYDLLTAQRTLAPGAGFADVNVYLPSLKLLRFIAIISAILLWISPWFKNWTVIWAALALLVGGSFLARSYASVIQKFQVAPNEIVKETPYLNLAIQYTRNAYGLTQVQELEFDPQENLSFDAIRKNETTIQNVRLWEHKPLLTSYGQLQEIRTYYDFLDADNDRYVIDGKVRQVMISARELIPESLPSRIWINEHLTYTHGYGVCLGPVNRISPEGLPEFFIKDLPPVSNINLKVTRPEIYFGESRSNYSIVNTHAKEFDYPAGDQNVYTNYNGTGGVPVGNFWRRLLFAIRFRELKILFSSDITPESRFLYYRSVRERLNEIAPFLRFDVDPYMVITKEGKLVWLVDGYTITDQFPYSEKMSGINYIRNSVKAVVDAYHGSVELYISDPQDPLIQTYSKMFPDLFKSMEKMDVDIKSHIRYPMTLMNIQARIYATYHMTDPQVFYNKEDMWKIPARGSGDRSEVVDPYYTIMKLAQVGEKEEFILMAPFTPAKKENMIAWMAARCDDPNYGKLLVYNFPKQKLVYGPKQIESRIDQDTDISKQLTLWDQGGSRVLRGSLLVIPVEQSLLYVQPLYLEASGGGLPELKRVIVAYGNTIAMEENFESALSQIFSGKRAPLLPTESLSRMKQGGDSKSLSREALDHYQRAQNALKAGDWSRYGDEIKRVEQILQELNEK